MNIRVTNGNKDWTVRDRFGGVQYEFKPNTPVVVPSEAAEHIFGYGLDRKGRWQKFLRMGIANHPKGREMWENIKMVASSNVVPTGAVREAA